MSIAARIVVAALVLLTGETAATAQETAGAGPEVFLEAIDVNVVNVEVYVTDKQGRRVVGLERDDFELRVDGGALPIDYFYAVDGGAVRPAAGLPTIDTDGRRPIPAPPREPAEVPLDQRLHLVVYVDNFNIDPLNRNRLFRYVRTFLRGELGARDRVMLVSYERSLHERLPFTSDHGLVADELFELEKLSGLSARAQNERRQLLDAIYEEANPDPRDQVISRASHYAQSLFNDLEFTLDALGDLLETLSGLPGRKAILYLSDGLAMRAAEDVFFALQERWNDGRFLLEAHRYNASGRFEQLAVQANAHRVTFYAVDAAGLRTYSYNDAENSGPTGGVAIDETHFANLQSPLQFLAGETGGLAIVNTNRFAPQLARIADDFDSYYSLGFTPAPGNMRYRRLDVDVKGRKGLIVRHREGYRDKPPAAHMTDGTLAALHYGFEQNDLRVEIEFGRATPSERQLYQVPVILKIPIAELEFLPGDGVERGRVQIYVAVRSDDGALSPVQEVPVTIDIPSAEIERARQHLYHHEITLLMRRGRQLLAVGVRDEVGAARSFVTRGTEIGG